MAWFGNVSLGNFPDLAGAVTKLSESVKNIEKNFDSALGLEDKPGGSEGLWPSPPDSKTLFKPVMAFMGHKSDDSAAETSGKDESLKDPKDPSITEEHNRISVTDSPIPEVKVSSVSAAEVIVTTENESEEFKFKEKDSSNFASEEMISNAPCEFDEGKSQTESNSSQVDAYLPIAGIVNAEDSPLSSKQEGGETTNSDESQSNNSNLTSLHVAEEVGSSVPSLPDESQHVGNSEISHYKQDRESEQFHDNVSPVQRDVPDGERANLVTGPSVVSTSDTIQCESAPEVSDVHLPNSISDGQEPFREADSAKHDNIGASDKSLEMSVHKKNLEVDGNEQSRAISVSNSADPTIELEKLRKEMKLMEAALQGAARQAQSKADEIARLMNENEQLKSTVEDLKRKSSEAEVDALREEYHQKVAALERKVYALTREKDTLRREQSKKSEAAALLKEKDEIISQVMAEGEELSKKQAAQEATIRKLRAQIREFEEEKQRLNSKLQVEEAKFESIKRDKVATEKLLQETIEKNQAELAAQKEFYTNALNVAKEAEALAEARANNEARTELESRLREASERESVLVQALEELRQGLSRTEQQAVFREDMLRRDIDDLQKRYQASELRYNELVSEVPESTRPLLRQIEAMQETTARRAEAWAGVERALNSRLQEAEAKAAAAEEKERAMNDRLSQSLSRITVLETQIACLRTEQTQLSRSLEKERQRASENRQEYLAAMEEAATQEGRAKQLEDEIKELRIKHKRVLQEELTKTELLEKELEREKSARMELEKTASRQISRTTSQDHISKLSSSTLGNGSMQMRKLSSAGSLGSMEESHFLQASLDSSGSSFSERRGLGETTMSPYFLKSMTPSTFEAALRHKDGELASYVSRLASLESIRDSLSEELVQLTEQCEKLRTEAAVLPGIRAELESLRRRHSSALELMGERDEALEELRNDIADLKEMYREQIDLLVNKIQVLSSSVGAAS